MNQIGKIIFLTLIFTSSLNGQSVTWQKWYDYNNYDNDANDVLQTSEGGYMFLGQSYQSANNSTILIKTNSLGIIEWQKLIDRNIVGAGVTCYSIHQTNDGRYVVSGYTSDYAVLFKTASDGELSWLRKYANMKFYNHIMTLDGGIIACGDSDPPFEGIVIKTDSIGNLQWENTDNINLRIIQSKDSNYYLGHPYRISKINKYGKTIWDKNLPSIGPYIVEDNERCIYTGGHPGADTMFLHKLDSSGNLIWKKNYYPGAHCQSMCMSKDSNILLAGYIDTLIQGNIAVTKVDLNGNLIFNKQIYSSFGENLSFLTYAVKSTTDNGFILTGFTNYPRFTSYHDNILAVKTDSLCNAPAMVGIKSESSIIPTDFILYQNYPNPFNPNTIINFELKISEQVKLKVFDNLGKEIITLVNARYNPGKYSVEFTGDHLPSGIYFYQLETRKINVVKKMILLK